MAGKQATCERVGCKIIFTKRRVWHIYCSSACRAIVWKAGKLAEAMTNQVMVEVENDTP